MDINEQIFEALENVKTDHTVPRNIKVKIAEIIDLLRSKQDHALKVNKALNMLDEISDDDNLQSYTRTQLWNIVSMLEAV